MKTGAGLGFLAVLAVSCFAIPVEAQFAYGPLGTGQQGLFDGYRTDRIGNFTPLAGSPFSGSGSLSGMLVSPKNDFLYIYNQASDWSLKVLTYHIGKDGYPNPVGSGLTYTPPQPPAGEFLFTLFSLISGSGRYIYINNTFTDDEGSPVSNQLSVLRIQKDGSVTFNPKEIYNFGKIGDGIRMMAGDPAGKFVYGLQYAFQGFDDSIIGATVASNGTLTPIPNNKLPADLASSIAMGPEAKYFYEFIDSATGGPQQLGVYQVGSNGSLTPIAGSPFSDAAGRFNITTQPQWHPTRKFAYALGFLPPPNTGAVGVYAYQLEGDGQLTPLPGSPFSLGIVDAHANNLVIDPKGGFLTVNGSDLNWVFEIQNDGSLTERANSPSPSIPTIDSFVGKE